MADFRVAHISDLHFSSAPNRANLMTFLSTRQARRGVPEFVGAVFTGAKQSTHSSDIAEKAAQKLLSKRRDLSLLLVSGDIACVGHREDLRAGLDYLVSPAVPDVPYLNSQFKPTISELKVPIFLLPGNHDRYRDHFGKSGGQLFDQVFSTHWGDPNPYVKTRVIQSPRSDDKLGIVAADFAIQQDSHLTVGPWWYRFGQGIAYPHIVSALKERTAGLLQKYNNIGIAWMIHFPPSEIACNNPALMLLNHQSVIDAAEESNVNIIFAGHIHRKHKSSDRGISIICAGSATCYMEETGNWLHFYKLQVSSGKVSVLSAEDCKIV
jgi:predicted phosphodiesterase